MAQPPKRKLTPLRSKTLFRSTSSFHSLTKIDPEVYTDVQSPGLVSRIAKYTEESEKNEAKQQRIRSLSNLYTRPGEFPIVHFRKEQIKISPKKIKTPMSSIRIPPPHKSLFFSQSRSTIFKKNLQTPAFHKLEPQIMRPSNIQNENEPIVPIEVIEPAPTRSALDDLREVSRKRINNEELDAERIKKQCKELTETDGAFQNTSGTKRPREIQSSSAICGLSNNQPSKRLRYNDIISSLTSSISLNTPKRIRENIQSKSNDQVREEPVHQEQEEPEEEVVAPVETAANIDEDNNGIIKDDIEGNKICMFNRRYADEEEKIIMECWEASKLEGDALFIVPKSTQDTTVKIGNQKGKKSQLQRMLNCLFGGLEENEGTTEPDTVQTDTRKESCSTENSSAEIEQSTNLGSIQSSTLQQTDIREVTGSVEKSISINNINSHIEEKEIEQSTNSEPIQSSTLQQTDSREETASVEKPSSINNLNSNIEHEEIAEIDLSTNPEPIQSSTLQQIDIIEKTGSVEKPISINDSHIEQEGKMLPLPPVVILDDQKICFGGTTSNNSSIFGNSSKNQSSMEKANKNDSSIFGAKSVFPSTTKETTITTSQQPSLETTITLNNPSSIFGNSSKNPSSFEQGNKNDYSIFGAKSVFPSTTTNETTITTSKHPSFETTITSNNPSSIFGNSSKNPSSFEQVNKNDYSIFGVKSVPPSTTKETSITTSQPPSFGTNTSSVFGNSSKNPSSYEQANKNDYSIFGVKSVFPSTTKETSFTPSQPPSFGTTTSSIFGNSTKNQSSFEKANKNDYSIFGVKSVFPSTTKESSITTSQPASFGTTTSSIFGNSTKNQSSFEKANKNDYSIFGVKSVFPSTTKESSFTTSQPPSFGTPTASNNSFLMRPNQGAFAFSGAVQNPASVLGCDGEMISSNKVSSPAAETEQGSTFSFGANNVPSIQTTAFNFGQENNNLITDDSNTSNLFAFGNNSAPAFSQSSIVAANNTSFDVNVSNQSQNPFPAPSQYPSQSMFSVGTGGGTNSFRTTPGARPIRTATRRLNK